MTKVQIKPSVNAKFARLLREEANRRNKSYGIFVDEALEQYFDPESAKTREAILLKRIDQLERKIGQVNNNLNIMSEAFTIYVKTYFSRMVELPAGQESAIMARTNLLFEKFINQVHSSCAAGNNLFNDLPKDDFIDEEMGARLMREAKLKGFTNGTGGSS